MGKRGEKSREGRQITEVQNRGEEDVFDDRRDGMIQNTWKRAEKCLEEERESVKVTNATAVI